MSYRTATILHRSGAAAVANGVLAVTLAACWVPDRPAAGKTASTAETDRSIATDEQWMPVIHPRRATVTDAGGSTQGSALGAASGTSAGASQGATATEADEDAGVSPASDGDPGSAGAAAPNTGNTIDAGSTAGAPATGAATSSKPNAACSREFLQQQLDAYLEALSAGTPDGLPLDPSIYYTENGKPETVGRGLWWSQPKVIFARHALDSDTCGSVTEAIVEDRLGNPIVMGLRLRHISGQIVDVETTIARNSNPSLFEPEKIVVVGMPDPWVDPIPLDKRMSREELIGVVEDFFGSISEPSLGPPRAPTCELRQNGATVGGDNCTPGGSAERFEQLRYPVVDVPTGLVGGVGIGHGYLVMFLFKIDQGTLINIDLMGGVASNTTGW